MVCDWCAIGVFYVFFQQKKKKNENISKKFYKWKITEKMQWNNVRLSLGECASEKCIKLNIVYICKLTIVM